MKFLVRNDSCLQNPWLRGHCPQIPVLSVLNWICWTPPSRKKFLGMPLFKTTPIIFIIIIIQISHFTAVQPPSHNSTSPTNTAILHSPLCHKLSHNTACINCQCFLHYNIQSGAEISSVKLSCNLFAVTAAVGSTSGVVRIARPSAAMFWLVLMASPYNLRSFSVMVLCRLLLLGIATHYYYYYYYSQFHSYPAIRPE